MKIYEYYALYSYLILETLTNKYITIIQDMTKSMKLNTMESCEELRKYGRYKKCKKIKKNVFIIKL